MVPSGREIFPPQALGRCWAPQELQVPGPPDLQGKALVQTHAPTHSPGHRVPPGGSPSFEAPYTCTWNPAGPPPPPPRQKTPVGFGPGEAPMPSHHPHSHLPQPLNVHLQSTQRRQSTARRDQHRKERGRAGKGTVRRTARQARPVRTAEAPVSEASILWGYCRGI